MVDPYFTTETGIKGFLIEAASGGLATLTGIYLWSRIMGPAQQLLSRFLGRYSGPVTAVILALIMLYIARSLDGWFGKFVDVASLAMIGASIAKVFGIDPPGEVAMTPSKTPAFVSPWSTLEPIPLG